MKIRILILFTVFLFLSAGVSSAVDINIQTGGSFDWWKDNKDLKGFQVYVPLTIEAQHKTLSLGVLTGYTYTNFKASGQDSQFLSTILDTKVNLSYGLLGKLPVDILFGLDLNIPTGKTDLKQEDLVLIMDPDLVTINTFGEGFNVNPTLSISKEIRNLVIGAGVGYLWRGKYDFSTDIGMKDYDPGDMLNANAEVRYYFSDNLYTRVFGGYVWFTKNDKVESEDFYQEGNLSLAGIGLNYAKPKWDTGLTVRGIFRGKSKFINTGGWLSTEEENSHGIEWMGDLYFRYFIDKKTALKACLQGLRIEKNGYPVGSSYYIGQRRKLSLGLGGSKALSKVLKVELDVKGFLMHDDEARFPEFRSARDYKGFSAMLMLKASL